MHPRCYLLHVGLIYKNSTGIYITEVFIPLETYVSSVLSGCLHSNCGFLAFIPLPPSGEQPDKTINIKYLRYLVRSGKTNIN